MELSKSILLPPPIPRKSACFRIRGIYSSWRMQISTRQFHGNTGTVVDEYIFHTSRTVPGESDFYDESYSKYSYDNNSQVDGR